jgi:glycosyltransferase involved in cell wall biosynthesis
VASGTRVDVLTTCAVDHFTWANVLRPGQSIERGVTVRRFPVGPRDGAEHTRLHGAIDRGFPIGYAEQVEWMATSVWSPEIIEAGGDYEWVIALPYLFGTSFWTSLAYPDNCVLMPCLHDENHARQDVILDSLASVRGVMLNSEGERSLLSSLLTTGGRERTTRNAPVIVGGGFDEVPLPAPIAVRAFCVAHGMDPGYVLYAGRREQAKGVETLFDHYRAYRTSTPNPVPLALMGSGDTPIPHDLKPHVIDLGFVPLAQRDLAYAGASVLIHPSRLESFGMVLFEAWLAGTPVLANGASPVLDEHCKASEGGLVYTDRTTFIQSLRLMLDDPDLRRDMAQAGREYTVTQFRWDAVLNRFRDALEVWA